MNEKNEKNKDMPEREGFVTISQACRSILLIHSWESLDQQTTYERENQGTDLVSKKKRIQACTNIDRYYLEDTKKAQNKSMEYR